MICKFWWGSKEGQRTTSRVSWGTIIQPKYAGGLGFRDIELFNLALLERQAWQILQVPDSLSARVMKTDYFPNGDILSAEVGSHPSQVWRSILEGRDTLKIGLNKRISDGASTSAWDKNWLPRDVRLRPVAPRSLHPPLMFLDFIDQPMAAWNVSRLEEHFLPADVEIIKNIPSRHRRQSDFWAWHYEKMGIFSVHSCYPALASTKREREAWLDERPGTSRVKEEEEAWLQLWGIKAPTKERIFLWRRITSGSYQTCSQPI
jgi:hypothetical protein